MASSSPPRCALALVVRDDGAQLDPRTESEWLEWVPASATRNWCREDPLLDWLNLHGKERGFLRDDERPGYDARYDFGRFVLEQGIKFEKAVIGYLARSTPVTTVAKDPGDTRSLERAQATWKAIERGDPIIAQAVLRDPESRMHGAADLLVRSDVLAKLVPRAFTGDPGDTPSDPAPALGGGRWNYRVV